MTVSKKPASGTPLGVTSAKPSSDVNDYPPVARWDWDRSVTSTTSAYDAVTNGAKSDRWQDSPHLLFTQRRLP